MEVLKLHNIPIAGIIFNGIENKESESFIKIIQILRYTEEWNMRT